MILVLAHEMHGMGYFEGNVSVANVLDSHELHHQLNVCYGWIGVDFPLLSMQRDLLS